MSEPRVIWQSADGRTRAVRAGEGAGELQGWDACPCGCGFGPDWRPLGPLSADLCDVIEAGATAAAALEIAQEDGLALSEGAESTRGMDEGPRFAPRAL